MVDIAGGGILHPTGIAGEERRRTSRAAVVCSEQIQRAVFGQLLKIRFRVAVQIVDDVPLSQTLLVHPADAGLDQSQDVRDIRPGGRSDVVRTWRAPSIGGEYLLLRCGAVCLRRT